MSRIWTRTSFTRFADTPEAKELRKARLANSKAFRRIELPKMLQAELRPYQKDGFDFLAHLVPNQTRRHSRRRHGPRQNAADADVAGVAARSSNTKNPKPSLVICPGVGVAQLAARGGKIHAEPESARAGKRRGAAQFAQTDSAARFDRHELRAAAARLGGVAQIRLPRGDFGRGAVHQKSRRAGHAIGQAVEVRKQASRSPARRWKTGCWICGASWISSSPAISAIRNNFWKLTNRAAKMPSPNSASRAAACPRNCVRSCCAA